MPGFCAMKSARANKTKVHQGKRNRKRIQQRKMLLQAPRKPRKNSAEILDEKSGDTDLKPTAETTAQNNTAGMF